MFGRVGQIAFFALFCGACVPEEYRDRHARTVESYLETPFIGREQPYVDPERALGPPDGRTVALGEGAYLILRFFRAIPDGPGDDLRIYEIGPDQSEAYIAVSIDGQEFLELSQPAQGPSSDFDLADLGLPRISFVRIQGTDNLGPEPGFDLDAVEALH